MSFATYYTFVLQDRTHESKRIMVEEYLLCNFFFLIFSYFQSGYITIATYDAL